MFKDRKYSSSLVEELRCLNIRWDAQSDISIGRDSEFLKKIRKAGCVALFIGFESLSSENLKSIDKCRWKFKHFKHYSDYIKRIQSNGIGILGAFIIGFDSDDATIFKRTADFIIKNNLVGAQISILTPFPGSRLRDKLEREKRILHKGWDVYTGCDVVFIPNKISPLELQNKVLETYRHIYNAENRLRRARYFKRMYFSLFNKNSV